MHLPLSMREGEFNKGHMYIFKPKVSDIGCILHVKVAIDNRFYCIQGSGGFHSMAMGITYCKMTLQAKSRLLLHGAIASDNCNC